MHSLPHRRRGVALGLVNVRGELLICASVARLLGLEAEVRGQKPEVRSPISNLRSPTSGFPRLLVTNWNGLRLAFPVDEVQGIQRFPKAELKSPPATISKSTLGYTQGVFGWRDRTVGLLDTEPFFTTLNRSLALSKKVEQARKPKTTNSKNPVSEFLSFGYHQAGTLKSPRLIGIYD